ncbi:MAG: HNH endonuclease [Bacteroidales bacterium]|nr:HNH endonuclease [Candidatus Latescibacterota bacterium]
MAITDKTRKLLWGRAGNRCALCRCELVVDKTDADEESVVGEECHIVSPKPSGPRHRANYPVEKFDLVENLMLLCRVHHKVVDDQVETYTEQLLRDLRKNHEQWVSARLEESPIEVTPRIRRIPDNIPEFLERLETGRGLIEVVQGAYASSFDHEELESAEEVQLVGGFLQELHDWAETWPDLEPVHKTKATYNLSQSLRGLEAKGFFVFGAKEVQQLESGQGPASPWPLAIIRVLRNSSPTISIVEKREDSSS